MVLNLVEPQSSGIGGGIHAIVKKQDGLFGAADSRREGIVMGE